MRVAYLCSQYPAPSHTFIRREVQSLRKQGIDIRTFSIRPPAKVEVMSDVDRRDQEETFYVLPPRLGLTLRANAKMLTKSPGRFFKALSASFGHRNPGLRNFVYAGFYFLEGMILAEEIQRQGIEHLHGHFANASAHAALAAVKYTGIGWSMSLHGLSDFDYPGGTLLGDKIKHTNFVGCVTEYGRAQAMRLSEPEQWSKLFIVRCGIDLERLPQSVERSPRQGLRIICVARLSPEKGVLGLLQAFAEAKGKGLDAELVLVGDGPDRDAVEQRIADLNILEHVTLKGRLPEAKTLEAIADADMLVLASFMEGLPVVLMEALALNVPVIAPCIAGIPELVEHGKTGYLFPASNWSALADRMLEMAADFEGRRKMAEAGRKRIVEEFDISTSVTPLYERFGGARSEGSGKKAKPSMPRVQSA
ncbi:MAG: glycosyltransferase family 4 protein [Myxococcota bacterium]